MAVRCVIGASSDLPESKLHPAYPDMDKVCRQTRLMQRQSNALPRLVFPDGRRRRGVALILVLMAVVVTATIALSYVATQGTSISVARNITEHSRARYVAESGLEPELCPPAFPQVEAGIRASGMRL